MKKRWLLPPCCTDVNLTGGWTVRHGAGVLITHADRGDGEKSNCGESRQPGWGPQLRLVIYYRSAATFANRKTLSAESWRYTEMDEDKNWITFLLCLPHVRPLRPPLICDQERQSGWIWLSLSVCGFYFQRLFFVIFQCSFISNLLFCSAVWGSGVLLAVTLSNQRGSQLWGWDAGVSLPSPLWKETRLLCCPEWLFLFLVFHRHPESLLVISVRPRIVQPHCVCEAVCVMLGYLFSCICPRCR